MIGELCYKEFYLLIQKTKLDQIHQENGLIFNLQEDIVNKLAS